MQVPAQFEYQRATSVEHAIALLARHGPETRVVAGGHSLIPMMKLRLAQPEMVVDINDLTQLASISITGGVDTRSTGAPLGSCGSVPWSGTPSCSDRPTSACTCRCCTTPSG